MGRAMLVKSLTRLVLNIADALIVGKMATFQQNARNLRVIKAVTIVERMVTLQEIAVNQDQMSDFEELLQTSIEMFTVVTVLAGYHLLGLSNKSIKKNKIKCIVITQKKKKKKKKKKDFVFPKKKKKKKKKS